MKDKKRQATNTGVFNYRGRTITSATPVHYSPVLFSAATFAYFRIVERKFLLIAGAGTLPLSRALNGITLPYITAVSSLSCLTEAPLRLIPAKAPRVRE